MIYKIRKSNPYLEILLLTCNNLVNTKSCIDHLFKHTYDFALIIIDNGSTDETPSYLKELTDAHDNITLCMKKHNMGVVDGRNFAYEMSLVMTKPANYVCFLDNDQLVQKGWVKNYFDLLDRGADIVGAEGWQMRDDFYPMRKVTKGSETFSYVGCGGMMFSHRVIDIVGVLDERFNPMYFEDPDFCFRAVKAGFKIKWDTKDGIFHIPHRLLGNQNERAKQFRKSWKLFQEKWKEESIPMMSNVEK